MRNLAPRILLTSGFLFLALGCSANTPAGPDAPLNGTQSRDDYNSEQMNIVFNIPIPPQPVDEVIAFLEEDVDPYQFAADNGITVIDEMPGTNLALFDVAGMVEPAFDGPDIRISEANDVVIWSIPVDLTLGFSQGEWIYEEAEGSEGLASMNLAQTHNYTTGKGVRVAVLDTGVEPNHPHLIGRVDMLRSGELGSKETPNGIDDDGNGTIDDAYGHGTHVAGTVLMVAPEARILSIRVLNEEGWGTVYDLALGLALARQYKVHVVNLSLALTNESQLISQLIKDCVDDGIAVMAASGNSYGPVLYPGSDINSVSVAATDLVGGLALFSGAFPADIAAPGEAIASSYQADKLAYGTGTSMACAVASGALALVAEHPIAPVPLWAVSELKSNGAAIAPAEAVTNGVVKPLKSLGTIDLPHFGGSGGGSASTYFEQ